MRKKRSRKGEFPGRAAKRGAIAHSRFRIFSAFFFFFLSFFFFSIYLYYPPGSEEEGMCVGFGYLVSHPPFGSDLCVSLFRFEPPPRSCHLLFFLLFHLPPYHRNVAGPPQSGAVVLLFFFNEGSAQYLGCHNLPLPTYPLTARPPPPSSVSPQLVAIYPISSFPLFFSLSFSTLNPSGSLIPLSSF